ncbi:MAG: FAD binding domain-containing protein [Anaerolineaceae bacterium]|nr:FAD binding domain-containing protein [Anaerolineaceae bacterium]
MWTDTLSATTIDEVLQTLAQKGDRSRIVAGATDLILEIERGARKGIETVVDVSRIPGLADITYAEDGTIHLGPLVTHNHCVASKLIYDLAFPLARACWEVGSPQIRNRGTIAGNLVTASPANDTITPLMAMGAELTLQSVRGKRKIALKDFYHGVRRTDLQPDEMLVDIAFPGFNGIPNNRKKKGTFIKFALRQAQAISLVNVAIILTIEDKIILEARIALGAVAPTIVSAEAAEQYLIGKYLEESHIAKAAELAVQAARPISDVRGSAGYRRRMVQVLVRRGLRAIDKGEEKLGMPQNPVLLWGGPGLNPSTLDAAVVHTADTAIQTRINGKEYKFVGAQDKTLLRLLREDAGLIGSKEGCAEGECGACTVFLDGAAVMSCMVPAPRAHGAEIVTIEGLGGETELHPVQTAFIDTGAVQCGYCTPGFLMSAAKLLEEKEHPSQDEIKQAITGNLCRCTGYYKIVEAIEQAALKGVS